MDAQVVWPQDHSSVAKQVLLTPSAVTLAPLMFVQQLAGDVSQLSL